MKKILFLALWLFGFTTTAQETISKNVGDFTILKVYNGITLELIKSKDQKLEISGEKASKVKIKNVDNTLKIYLPFSLKPENNAANGEVLVKLYYNTAIITIDANEGATITGKKVKQEQLEVKSQERAFINLVVDVKVLKVKAISGGIVKLTGTATTQNVNTDLYGIYNGFDLKVKENSNVKAGTGAKAEVFAGSTLNAQVSFGGSIFYKGNTKLIENKKVIGGIIQKRD